MRMGVIALWGAAFVASTGCSIVAVRPSPTVNERTGVGVCGTALVPTLDVLGTVGFTLLGAVGNAWGAALGECGKYPNDPSCHGHWEAYIPAAIAAGSAIYGYWAVHR